jgi:hypothetical protein
MQSAKLLVDNVFNTNQSHVSDVIIPLILDVSKVPKLDVMLYVRQSGWGKTWLLTNVVAACAVSTQVSMNICFCSRTMGDSVAACNNTYGAMKRMGVDNNTVKKAKLSIVIKKGSESVLNIKTSEDADAEYHDPFNILTVNINFVCNEDLLYPEIRKVMTKDFDVIVIDDVLTYEFDLLKHMILFTRALNGTRFITMGKMKHNMTKVEPVYLYGNVLTVVDSDDLIDSK